jgi:hypothetical protein
VQSRDHDIVGKVAVEEKGGGEWTRITRQRAKGNIRANTSEPAAKAIKVFASTGELKRKRKAEYGTTEQVAQLKELVHRLLRNNKEHDRVASNQPTSNQAVRLVGCLCKQGSYRSIVLKQVRLID